ncbi:MAG TPA: Kdo hydroxylase family protein [Thermoanaerobaculia bacterium]|nr:Kdo hydroxylase family protein [Thermoanaerobaculia bacterium]
MASVVEIPDPASLSAERRIELQKALEQGRILYFPRSPIAIEPDDRTFLLGLRQSGAAYHKNIAYRPESNRVTGFAAESAGDSARLRAVLRRYSRDSIAFLAALFPSYGAAWKVDYASFRALEEAGRDLSPAKKNDLMHVDAFPTRPTRGDRILRFFTNVNPSEDRHWKTGTDVFPALAERYAASSGLLGKAVRGGAAAKARSWAAAAGLPVAAQSAYDRFMLGFHDYLKGNAEYQREARTDEFRFPPGSAWMVFTDTVSHAVLSGRFALEQTFLIRRASLALPESAPIAVLEKLAGRALA